jgi:hypothetical protein
LKSIESKLKSNESKLKSIENKLISIESKLISLLKLTIPIIVEGGAKKPAIYSVYSNCLRGGPPHTNQRPTLYYII